MTEEYPLRLFYHGLIKAAVGLLHLKRHNLRGARIKLTEAEATLAPFVPIIMGIDVGSLLNDIQQHLELVRGDLPLNRDEIDRLPLTQIRDPI